MNEFPRRIQMQKWIPAEHAIYDAMQAVEIVGADLMLTDALILLGKAKDKVADYVDAHPEICSASPAMQEESIETLINELEMAHWAFVDAEYADDDAPPSQWQSANKNLAAARTALLARYQELERELDEGISLSGHTMKTEPDQ